ncbi:hypothetical protein QFC24_002821 [Naganishia onofrii]|uniref:Uncharacterized protein n=1 Tax=Naganishia onofrii TaxID=1851511 RepID=A0ACC2XQA8_9TREE|nr:hypothetical protein QFC24_002821 [Naganishia onofrii]
MQALKRSIANTLDSTMAKRLILYSADVCPYAHRARVALKASGADFEIVEIDLKNKPEWYQPKINPASKVPALWYDAPKDADPSSPPAGTFILPESSLIVNFVESVYPELQFKDPIKRAQSALMAHQWESTVNSAWFKYTMSDGGKGEKLDDFLEAVRKFIPYIPDGYVESSEFGAADASIAPFLTRIFEFSKRNAYPWTVENSGQIVLDALSAPEFEKLRAYADKLAKWNALSSTVDWDINEKYMKKHMPEMKARINK